MVNNYKPLEEENLLRKRQNIYYSLEFKLDMIKYYLRTEISYQDLALNDGISNSILIPQWVSEFRKHGVAGVSKTQRRSRIMKSNNNCEYKKSNEMKKY